jgi:hypothetical protein
MRARRIKCKRPQQKQKHMHARQVNTRHFLSYTIRANRRGNFLCMVRGSFTALRAATLAKEAEEATGALMLAVSAQTTTLATAQSSHTRCTRSRSYSTMETSQELGVFRKNVLVRERCRRGGGRRRHRMKNQSNRDSEQKRLPEQNRRQACPSNLVEEMHKIPSQRQRQTPLAGAAARLKPSRRRHQPRRRKRRPSVPVLAGTGSEKGHRRDLAARGA